MQRLSRFLTLAVLFIAASARTARAGDITVLAGFAIAGNYEVELNDATTADAGSGEVTDAWGNKTTVTWQRDAHDNVIVSYLGTWVLAFEDLSRTPPAGAHAAQINTGPPPEIGSWIKKP